MDYHVFDHGGTQHKWQTSFWQKGMMMKVLDSVIKLLTKLFNDNVLIARYSLIGLLGAIIDYALYFVLIQFDVQYIIANIISVSIVIIVNFIMNMRLNFRHASEAYRRHLSYFLTGILALILSIFIIFVMVESYKLSYMQAKLITLALLAIIKLALNSGITLRKTW